MSKAIRVHAFGGPEQLKWEDVDLPAPGKGEVRIRHDAVGLNFIDIYHRTGLYPQDLPFTPGQEGAGEVVAVGEGVNSFRPGDKVCYQGALGAYADERNIAASKLIRLPDDIPADVAAASLLKGLTVCYLLEMTWPVKASETILWHAAAGGVGQIAVQWAKSIGATLIATAGSDEKIKIAKDLGADHVINLEKEEFVARVREITGGKGVDVVYDSIGKDTFERSLDCLRTRGLMVSFGNSSGPVAVKTLGILASKGSLYVTRPTLAGYFTTPEEEQAGADKLFEKIRSGAVKISIGQEFPLADAAKAHEALAGRKTKGATVLRP